VNPNEWAGIGVALVTLISAFTMSIRFLVKHYFSELRPDGNGGHNLRGKVDRIEEKVDFLYELILEDRTN
jgi:hypothetical protein